HQVDGFTEIAMCVDIHRQDALAIDFDGQARGLRLGVGRIQNTATAKGDSARRGASQEIPSGGHWSPPSIVWIRFLRPVDRRAGSFFILLAITLPTWMRKGNHSG